MLMPDPRAIFLVIGLAGLAIALPLFLTHAAYVYVIALTYSSTGEDRFRWPSEMIMDWPAHAFPLLGVGFVASALCFTLTAPLLAILTWEQYAVCFAVILYLVLPLVVGSAFTAPSRLLLIYPPTIGRLIRQTAGVARVHAITLPFSAGVVVGVFLFMRANPTGLVLIVALLPLAVLLHARAWGRLLWLALNYDLPEPRKRKKRRGPRPTPSGEILESPSLEAIPQETTTPTTSAAHRRLPMSRRSTSPTITKSNAPTKSNSASAPARPIPIRSPAPSVPPSNPPSAEKSGPSSSTTAPSANGSP